MGGGVFAGQHRAACAWRLAWLPASRLCLQLPSLPTHPCHVPPAPRLFPLRRPCMQDRLSQRFPGVKFVVEAKADATYPIVSAGEVARWSWLAVASWVSTQIASLALA